MKRFILLIIFISFQQAYGQLITYTNQYRNTDLVLTGGVFNDVLYDDLSYDSDGNLLPAASRTAFVNKSSRSVFTLFTNPYLLPGDHSYFQFKIRMRMTYRDSVDHLQTTEYIRLSIDYSPEERAAHRSKDIHTILKTGYVRLEIDSLGAVDERGSPIPLSDLSSAFFIRHQLQVERYYHPVPSERPASILVSSSSASRLLTIRWRPVLWASHYEVEWTYVDDYDRSAPSGRRAASALTYDFASRSTRITTYDTRYEVPDVFESGYVIFRVRAVGKSTDDFDQDINGKWSLGDRGTVSLVPSAYRRQISGLNVHERDQKNWQYIADYSEDGKHKEEISYLDGSYRVRQTVTESNTQKNLLVAESMYDHVGRPAVTALPSPNRYTGSTLSRPLSFQPNFNLAPDGRAYSRRDFDMDAGTGCGLHLNPFGTTNGAGNYFSPSNPDQNGHQGYLPDAHGYPFVQTEYTPDNTGRIRRQGGAGPAFQLGSGHEQHYFYTTPSQNELDRIFGNEVGFAAHYKKEIVIDENGQTHISYKDSKGNVVATALGGRKPDNLEPIETYTAETITINLLEEENRREAGSNRLISSKSIYIAQPTQLDFEYRLTSDGFRDRPCILGADVCYDCVYDLEIVVRDDCGLILYNVDERIGNLNSIRSCESTPFENAGSITIEPGNYFITKRLTVNADAVDAYIEDYLSGECFITLRETLIGDEVDSVDPEQCNSTCNECQYGEIQQSYQLTKEDGTIQTVTIPARVRQEVAGGCAPVCPAARPDECQAAFAAMLSDMSPGGQYALYIDSTRIAEDNPLGPINPDVFPVSILNESNRLPVRNVSWRTPFFDYRNDDGSEALIELNDRDEPFTSHIITIDGRRFTKPQHLEDVADFIHYWKPSWAESLVPFHPEYFYYVWCREQQGSYNYDTLLFSIPTYDEASAHTSVGTLLDSDYLNDTDNDPFFIAHSALVSDMSTRLQNVLSDPSLARSYNIAEAVAIANHCNNRNFTAAQVESCQAGSPVYSNPFITDKDWLLYRSIYRSTKRGVMDDERERYMLANRYFSNRFIGEDVIPFPGLNPFTTKTKRFPTAQDAATYLPDEHGRDFTDDIDEFINYHTRQRYQTCGLCPVAYDLQALLTGLALEKSLSSEVQLPGAPPLTLTRSLLDAFSISDRLQYSWMPVAVDNHYLEVSITTSGSEVCRIQLSKDVSSPWEDIQAFTCIEPFEGYGFKMRALTQYEGWVDVYGEASCLNLTQCALPNVCLPSEESDDLAVFLEHMFQENRFLSTSYRVHERGLSSPHFGESLRAVHPTADFWDWKFIRWNTTGKNMLAELTILRRDNRLSPYPIVIGQCQFHLFTITPGEVLQDAERVISIRKAPGGLTGCEKYDFILVVEKFNGARFEVGGTTTCYPVSDCCASHGGGHTGNGVCCIPMTPVVPFIPTCDVDNRRIAAGDGDRLFYDRIDFVRDSIRTAYINHCLDAAEEFILSYEDAIYHYTLYYYDKAGNLVKTVPPKGVHLLSDTQIESAGNFRRGIGSSPIVASHTMATTYKYNTLNEAIERVTPDGGITRYCYDEIGRVILSQDAVQAGDGTCSYVIYDDIGRVQESGKVTVPGGTGAFPHKLRYNDDFLTRWVTGTKTEIIRTYYDSPLNAAINSRFQGGQQNLRNRVASITYQYEAGAAYDHATHYSYDVLGNTRELIQEFARLQREHPVLASGGHHFKKVVYDYDLVSGNVNRIIYQPGQADQFIHWYEYDADNRMTQVKTSRWLYEDDATKDVDAAYAYYKHGPLSRMELGKEKVQGVDYAYTLQGQVKGMNSNTLLPVRDIGKDGDTGIRQYIGKDVFGYSLSFFDDDYHAIAESTIGSANHFLAGYSGSGLEANSLYDGNIRHVATAIKAFENPVQASTYRYDQLGRLTNMRIFRDATPNLLTNNTWSSGDFVSSYETSLSFDANGNISQLDRKNADGGLLDQLSYNYNSANNQLRRITDGATTPDYPLDLENQPTASNYDYDAKGRLVQDLSEKMTSIEWTVTDKIKRILYTDDCCPGMSAANLIEYDYNAGGHRVWKENSEGMMYFVRDNQGNILSTYRIQGDSITWNYAPVYGTTRIGIFQPGRLLDGSRQDFYYSGSKHYELVNHVGSVMTTVTDRKLPDGATTFKPDISSAQEYYPFGMLMPGRNLEEQPSSETSRTEDTEDGF